MKKHINSLLVKQAFIEFVQEVKEKICKIDDNFEWKGMDLESDIDHNNPENIEKIMLFGWNSMAHIWPAVEANGNYTATITSIIERLFERKFPTSRKVRILSLGAGPGLYEIFLAYCFKSCGIQSRIFSTDYSKGMIEFQERVLMSDISIARTKVSSLREILSPRIVDMTDLSQFRDSIDIIICNNALQWVKDWQKAIFEMSQTMRIDGLKYSLLFVHPHAMKLSVGGTLIQREYVAREVLFDVLNEANFSPLKTRFMIGRPGSGQSGAPMNRMMIEAQFYPNGIKTHWRNMHTSIAGMKTMEIPK